MCGIWGHLLKKENNHNKATFAFSNLIKHRGPDETVHLQRDWSDTWDLWANIVFHRLAIVDVENGQQPFIDRGENGREIILVANGEIYNYRDLCAENDWSISSDCLIILELYKKYGIVETCRLLEGEFAFVILDSDPAASSVFKVFLARDRFGIRPLFASFLHSWQECGFYFASEHKAIPSELEAHHIPPRCIQSYEFGRQNSNPVERLQSFYEIPERFFCKQDSRCDTQQALDKWYANIRDALVKSVKDRMYSERPLGCLLSGGLDSSLVAGIAAKHLRETGGRLQTFSIGITDTSPDILYARQVAEFIDSDHHEIIIPASVWLETIPKVVYQIETFDTTTVRASTAQYLIGEWISQNTDVKVLLNGDGSDEITGGYLYFYNAPDGVSFDKECKRLLSEIHYYDVLRVDRGLCAHGLEARVPFLCHDFVETYLSAPVQLRASIKDIQMEKHLLRASFAQTNLIPHSVLWRRKEAFSDGVSPLQKSWFEIISENIPQHISVEGIKGDCQSRPGPLPPTREAAFYRHLFDEFYPSRAQILETGRYWLPRWCGAVSNPSARILDVYKEH